MLLRASIVISIPGFPRWLQGRNINRVPAGLLYTRSQSEGEKCLSCHQTISILCTAARFHVQQRRPFIKDTFPSNKGSTLSPRHAYWQLEFLNGSKFPSIEFWHTVKEKESLRSKHKVYSTAT